MFSKDDRGLALRRAMQLPGAPTDLPVAASVAFFASEQGFPVLVLSAGVPASALDAEKPKDKPLLSATAIVRVADVGRTRLPMYFERRLEAPLAPGFFSCLKSDKTAFLANLLEEARRHVSAQAKIEYCHCISSRICD